MTKNIKSLLTKKNFLIVAVYLTVVTLPWSIWWNGFFIWSVVFFSLLHISKLDWKALDQNFKLYILLFAIYFLLNCSSLLYTENLKEGLFSIEKKFTFILIPCCILIATKVGLNREIILKLFLLTVVLATILCLIFAVKNNYSYNLQHNLPWWSFNNWF
jgi:hypothetical protein